MKLQKMEIFTFTLLSWHCLFYTCTSTGTRIIRINLVKVIGGPRSLSEAFGDDASAKSILYCGLTGEVIQKDFL